MKTFDFERAHHEHAAPAFEALPADVRELYARVATECRELTQRHDLLMPWPDNGDSMPWPEKGTLRAAFEALSDDKLAWAARVIYSAGHWYPATGRVLMAGREHGAHWKFSHYADQVLRARFAIASGHRAAPDGVSLLLIEGVIRVCYSSSHTWTWYEATPGTRAGFERAAMLASELRAALSTLRNVRDRDSAAHDTIEALRARVLENFPPAWHGLMNTDALMVDEGDLRVNPDRYRTQDERNARRAARRADLIHKYEVKRDHHNAEHRAMLYLFDQGFDLDNVIYYSHTGRVCFGWRDKLSPSEISKILDAAAEFPFDYDIKGYAPEVTA